MQRHRAGPKFVNSYQELNVPSEPQEEEQQHSNPSHDHAAKAAGKNMFIFSMFKLMTVLFAAGMKPRGRRS